MPGTAPRLRGVRHDRPASEMDRGDWDCGVLAQQLEAFERDIRATRKTAARVTARARASANASLHGERLPVAGGEIVIRPIEPDDAASLRSAFEELGALSRLRRFLTPIDRLSQRQLHYLTAVDHRSHEALVALDAKTGEGVGIARYVRDDRDPRQADVAVVVADRWQGRGVGTALLHRIAARAGENGHRRLTATVLLGNDAGRRLVAKLSVAPSEHRVAGATHVTARVA